MYAGFIPLPSPHTGRREPNSVHIIPCVSNRHGTYLLTKRKIENDAYRCDSSLFRVLFQLDLAVAAIDDDPSVWRREQLTG
jgi:hypothetical protein